MFHVREPSRAELETFLARQKNARFSYAALGATNTGDKPSGFFFDHRRTVLGKGEACFHEARDAMRAWRMFDLGWVSVFDPTLPIEAAREAIIRIRTLGIHATCAARIVYTIDEPRRFGFAYGTLTDHLESGEERFLIEWTANDEVVYDLSAFSRPHHPLLWLGILFTRRQQKRFARESSTALKSHLQRAGERSTTARTAASTNPARTARSDPGDNTP